jgi:hypothetical protein
LNRIRSTIATKNGCAFVAPIGMTFQKTFTIGDVECRFFLRHLVQLHLPVSTVEVHGYKIVAANASYGVVVSWGREAKRPCDGVDLSVGDAVSENKIVPGDVGLVGFCCQHNLRAPGSEIIADPTFCFELGNQG